MLHIFTRRYHDFDKVTGEEFELQDKVYRDLEDDESFKLLVAGPLPGDRAIEHRYNRHQVFEWLQECPEQIERVVIGAT